MWGILVTITFKKHVSRSEPKLEDRHFLFLWSFSFMVTTSREILGDSEFKEAYFFSHKISFKSTTDTSSGTQWNKLICSKPRRKKMIFQSLYWYSLKRFPRIFWLFWVFVSSPHCGIYILSKCMVKVTSQDNRREGRLVTPVPLNFYFSFFDVFLPLYYWSFFCCMLLLSHFSLLIALNSGPVMDHILGQGILWSFSW